MTKYRFNAQEIARMKESILLTMQHETELKDGKKTTWRLRLVLEDIVEYSLTERNRKKNARTLALYESLTTNDLPNWIKETPEERLARKKAQVNEMKAKAPERLMLFREGDFYNAYGEDAIECTNILGVTLTRYADGWEVIMFPYLALDTYLPKLIRAGKRISICDTI